MDNDFFFNTQASGPIERVDGKAKVTGSAAYAADQKIQNMASWVSPVNLPSAVAPNPIFCVVSGR